MKNVPTLLLLPAPLEVERLLEAIGRIPEPRCAAARLRLVFVRAGGSVLPAKPRCESRSAAALTNLDAKTAKEARL